MKALEKTVQRVGLAAGPAGSRFQVAAESVAYEGRSLKEALLESDAMESAYSAARVALRSESGFSVLGGSRAAANAMSAAARAGLSASRSEVRLPPKHGLASSSKFGRPPRRQIQGGATFRRTRLGYMA